MLRFSARELLNGLEGTAYVVDAQWRLVAVGQPNWRKFSDDNGGGALADEGALLGRPLADFIDGEPVRSLWASALASLDQGGVESVVVPYRCDAPTVHREMRMAVSAVIGEDGERYFLFHSVTLTERIRPPLRIFAPQARMGGNPPLVAMCSFCHSIRPGDEDHPWKTPEAYYADGGVSQVDITHSVCPDCHGDWLRSLGLAAPE